MPWKILYVKGSFSSVPVPMATGVFPMDFWSAQRGLCQGAFPVLPGSLPGPAPSGLRGPAHPPRVGGSPPPRAPVCLSGSGDGPGAAGLAEHPHLPGGSQFRDLAYAGPAYRQFVAALQGSFTTRAAIFATAHTDATLLLMDLLEESGLITRVGRVSMDRDCPEHLREPGPEAALEETRRWLEAVQGRYRRTGPILTPRFVPHLLRSPSWRSGKIGPGDGPAGAEPFVGKSKGNRCGAGTLSRGQLLCPGLRPVWAPGHRLHHGPLRPLPGGRAGASQGARRVHRPQSRIQLKPCLRRGSGPPLLGTGASGRPGLRCGRRQQPESFPGHGPCHSGQQASLAAPGPKPPPLTFDQVFWMATLGGGSFFGPVGTFAQGYAFDALVLDDRRYPTVLPLSIQQRVERLAYLAEESCLRQSSYPGTAYR